MVGHTRLGTKITIGFALMLLPLLVMGFMSFKALSDIEQNSYLYKDVETKSEKVGDLQSLIGRSAMELNDVYIKRDTAQAQEYGALHVEIDKAIVELQVLMSSPEAKQVMSRIKADMTLADAKAREVLAAVDSADVNTKMDEYDALAANALADADRLHVLIRQYTDGLSQEMAIVGKRTNAVNALVLAIALVVCISVIAWVRIKVIEPSKQMFLEFADASANLNSFLGEVFADSEHVNQASTKIATSLGSLSESSDIEHEAAKEVDKLIEQIALAVNQVANGAHEQSKDAVEINGMMGQFKSAIESVTSNAMTVAQYASESLGMAEQSKDSAEEATVGIERTTQTVLSSANKIQMLGEKSKQIGEIIEVIDDIAEQTNLLALNAAIEAARAGEHGKGFAVVADEVRKLAERSARATGEIAKLIKGIQDETLEAVAAIELGTKEVESGTELTKAIGLSIDEMIESIEEVMMQIASVRSACNAMVAISETVVGSVADIAAVTQENTALTQQVAASTESVTQTVDGMTSQRELINTSIQDITVSAGETSISLDQMTSTLQKLSSMANGLDKLAGSLKW
ncbi:MAG: methyl-accepting chemotaxis protein [Actinomycetota bacterium]|nr:methyl-accepting chemotaxis protein [Actinomycetota bacterium]